MRQLGEGRALFGFPGPGFLISSRRQPPLTLLGGADANASAAAQPTRRDVLFINAIPEKETQPAFRKAQKIYSKHIRLNFLLSYYGKQVTLM